MPSDIVTEARELLNFGAPMAWSDQPSTDELVKRAPELLRALADEVERLREMDGLLEADDIRACDKCDLCEDHHD